MGFIERKRGKSKRVIRKDGVSTGTIFQMKRNEYVALAVYVVLIAYMTIHTLRAKKE